MPAAQKHAVERFHPALLTVLEQRDDMDACEPIRLVSSRCWEIPWDVFHKAVGLKIILMVDETYSESIEFPAASMMGVRCRQRCAEPMSSCKAKRRQRLIIDGAAHRKPFFSKASPSYFSAHSPSMKET